jgi:hypothetical protein
MGWTEGKTREVWKRFENLRITNPSNFPSGASEPKARGLGSAFGEASGAREI